MTERARVFDGATELELAGGFVEITGDYLTDKAQLDIKPVSITPNTTLELRKSDGTTAWWTGKVEQIKRENVTQLALYGLGFELNNIEIQNVYTSQSPEAIVEDVIDRTTGLTYAGTASSGETVDKYIAKAYAIDIIKDQMDVLRWRLRIEPDGSTYFEPRAATETGIVYVQGTTSGSEVSCLVEDWQKDRTQLINNVRIRGGFENYATEETISGTGTTFSLSSKPNGTLRATVSGTEQDPSTFTVNAEDKEVVFDSSVTDPTFFYSYNRPVLVQNQDDDSINTYGEVFREIQAPWLTTTADARRYARKILDSYSTPLDSVKIRLEGLDFDREPNQVVHVRDDYRSESEAEFVVEKVQHDLTNQYTILELGERSLLFEDWTREVEERIKKLERRFQNDDRLYIVRLYKQKMNISLAAEHTFEYNSPVDSFIIGHHTLGRLRSSLAFEADCSDNSKHGTWTGTGVSTGSHYTTSGYRLSAGQGNGSDREITRSDGPFASNPSTAAVAFFAKFNTFASDQHLLSGFFGTSNGVNAYYDQSTDEFKVEYGLDTVQQTLTVSSFSSTYSTGTWYAFVLNFDATSGASLYIGTSSLSLAASDSNTGTDYDSGSSTIRALSDGATYANADLDELMVFDTTLNSSARTRMINKRLHDENDALNSNVKLWWSMDNPRLGDRSTSRQTVS